MASKNTDALRTADRCWWTAIAMTVALAPLFCYARTTSVGSFASQQAAYNQAHGIFDLGDFGSPGIGDCTIAIDACIEAMNDSTNPALEGGSLRVPIGVHGHRATSDLPSFWVPTGSIIYGVNKRNCQIARDSLSVAGPTVLNGASTDVLEQAGSPPDYVGGEAIGIFDVSIVNYSGGSAVQSGYIGDGIPGSWHQNFISANALVMARVALLAQEPGWGYLAGHGEGEDNSIWSYDAHLYDISGGSGIPGVGLGCYLVSHNTLENGVFNGNKVAVAFDPASSNMVYRYGRMENCMYGAVGGIGDTILDNFPAPAAAETDEQRETRLNLYSKFIEEDTLAVGLTSFRVELVTCESNYISFIGGGLLNIGFQSYTDAFGGPYRDNIQNRFGDTYARCAYLFTGFALGQIASVGGLQPGRATCQIRPGTTVNVQFNGPMENNIEVIPFPPGMRGVAYSSVDPTNRNRTTRQPTAAGTETKQYDGHVYLSALSEMDARGAMPQVQRKNFVLDNYALVPDGTDDTIGRIFFRRMYPTDASASTTDAVNDAAGALPNGSLWRVMNCMLLKNGEYGDGFNSDDTITAPNDAIEIAYPIAPRQQIEGGTAGGLYDGDFRIVTYFGLVVDDGVGPGPDANDVVVWKGRIDRPLNDRSTWRFIRDAYDVYSHAGGDPPGIQANAEALSEIEPNTNYKVIAPTWNQEINGWHAPALNDEYSCAFQFDRGITGLNLRLVNALLIGNGQ